MGRFTFERIHNTKEQIYFYKRAGNHKAKERMFRSFRWANFPGKHPEEGLGFICIEVLGFALLIYLIYLKYPMKMK